MNFKIAFFLSIFVCSLSYNQLFANGNSNFKLVKKDGINVDSLLINDDIVMLEDSLSKALLTSVNGFLAAAQENSQNKWILTSEAVETQILIDEIQDIQKSDAFENDSFFKPHLTNIIPLEDNKYSVHIAYVGINENSVILRANFELIAHKIDDIFLISSPLKRNTQNWKIQKHQNQVFYYPYTLDLEKVQRIHELTTLFDEKLKNTGGSSHFYLCNNEINPLKLFGVDYKSDYNGQKTNGSWVSSLDKKSLFVMNASRFYNYSEHDLWHSRLSEIISRKEVHRRVDCHIATIYGGIWGLSWDELFPVFCQNFVDGENVDWLEHKKNSSHFITKERRKNYSDDFVGALIVQKIEETKGFDGVWDLLMTKRTKGEEEYFSVLEKLTGITRESYNEDVDKLIEAEMESLGMTNQ